MKIVITGGNGFVGKHLIHLLSNSNNEILILDKKEYNYDYKNIKCIQFDISKDSYEEIFENVDLIIHLAAELLNPNMMYEINTSSTLRLLLAAEKAKIKKIIYTSSVAVYGTINKKIITEVDSICLTEKYLNTSDLFIYSISKLYSETEIIKYIKDCKVIIFRPSNIVDREILLNFQNWSFFTKLRRGNRFTHHIYVKDVVETINFTINNFDFLIGNKKYEIYNLTNDDLWIKYKDYYNFLNISFNKFLYIFSLPSLFSRITHAIVYKNFNLTKSIPSGDVIYSSKKLLKKYNYFLGVKKIIDDMKN
jgi:nucleoside-diphosphate-sugar epimerase